MPLSASSIINCLYTPELFTGHGFWRRTFASDVFGSASREIGTRNRDCGLHGFIPGRACRGTAKGSAVEFDAYLTVDFGEPHCGIDDECKERDKTGSNENFGGLRHCFTDGSPRLMNSQQCTSFRRNLFRSPWRLPNHPNIGFNNTRQIENLIPRVGGDGRSHTTTLCSERHHH